MKKNILMLCIALLLSSLISTMAAAAELQVSTELMLGQLRLDPLFGNGAESVTVTHYSPLLTAKFQPAEDALITVKHFNSMFPKVKFKSDDEAIKLGGQEKAKSSYTQVTAGYKFMEQDALTIYGGLGYQFFSSQLQHKTLSLPEGQFLKVTGSGFLGHVQVNLELMERLQANAVINGNPWYSWTYTEDGKTLEKTPSGSTYSYQLGVDYQINESYGVRVGYSGTTLGIPSFKYKSTDKPKTDGVLSGITLGVNFQF